MTKTNRLNLARCVDLSETEGEYATVETEAHTRWSTGWLARVKGTVRGKLEYEFQQADTKSLSRKGNGTKVYEISGDGYFAAASVWRSYSEHTVYFRVADAKIELLSLAEICASVPDLTPPPTLALTHYDPDKWPALVGSPKQIAWAEELRSKFTHNVQSLPGDAVQGAACRYLQEISSAKTWIDNRSSLDHFRWWVARKNRRG